MTDQYVQPVNERKTQEDAACSCGKGSRQTERDGITACMHKNIHGRMDQGMLGSYGYFDYPYISKPIYDWLD
jgi:hypothetical protein